MTGRDLISASLRLIGAIAPGESPAASEASDGLASINRMIDSWSNEDLLIYATTQDSLTLVAGTQAYTMGTGATFNTARPSEIQEAFIRVGSGTSAIDYPVRILSESEWANIRLKGVTSSIPHSLYIDGSYPNETLNLYPCPNAAYALVTLSIKPLTQIATLDTVISLPPGYERALVYNGATELAPEYGRQPSELIFNTATESKAALKRRNYKPGYLRVDSALIGGKKFNIFTGDN